MTREFLTIVLPLLLPTALYLLWAVSVGRAQTADAASMWRGFPWIWLTLAGVALVAVVVALVVQFDDSRTPGTYVPPRVENGEIVPGHVVPVEPAQH
jgi:hypothetical protein